MTEEQYRFAAKLLAERAQRVRGRAQEQAAEDRRAGYVDVVAAPSGVPITGYWVRYDACG